MTAPLLTSLEQAGEGSRELDAEIGRTFGGQVVARFGDYDWRAEGVGIWRALPLFTRSLDEAVALAERQGLDGWNTLYAAMMNWKAHDPRGPLSQTLPLALCLAILKATNPKGQPNA